MTDPKIRLKRMAAGAVLSATFFFLILLVRWIAPARGLTGHYFANDSWTEPVRLTRVDEQISFDHRALSEAAGIPGRFSVRWEGFLYVPKNGSYTISVLSDDGAWISIDDQLVVDNGGSHAAKIGQKEVALSRGGHRILIKYYDDGGDALINVPTAKFRFYPKPAGFGRYAADRACAILDPVLKAGFVVSALVLAWSLFAAAGLWFWTRVVVPMRRWFEATAFLRRVRLKIPYLVVAVAVMGLAFWAARRVTPVHGLRGTYYANPSFAGQPVFRTIDPKISFQTESIARRVGTEDSSSIVWEGEIYVPREASYRFSITSDDGSWIYIDGVLVVDNGGSHASISRQGAVKLSPGSHKIQIKYFDAGGGAFVKFSWGRDSGWGLLPRPLFLYPRPVHAGIARLDTVLFYLKILLLAGLVLFGGLLAFVLPGLLDPVLVMIGAWERAGFAHLEKILGTVGRKIAVLSIGAAGLIALALAARFLAPARGLAGTYFSNTSWEGPAESRTIDRKIRLRKAELFDRARDSDVLSVVWEGYAYIPEKGTYLFSLGSDDGSWFFLDDRLVIDNGGRHGIRTVEKEVELDRGNHAILLKYFDGGGDGEISFRVTKAHAPFWQRPRVGLYPRPADARRYRADVVLSVLRTAAEPLACLAVVLLALVLVRRLRPGLGFQPALLVVVFLVLAGRYEAKLFQFKSTSVRGCDSYAYLQGVDLMARHGFLRTEFVDPLVPQIHQRYEVPPTPRNEVFFFSPHGYYVNDLEKGVVYNVFPGGTSMLLYPFVKAGGRAAAFYVLPLMNAVLLLLFLIIGARTVNLSFGLLLAAVTFFNLHVFGNSVLIMSDVPSMALLAVSTFCLYRQTQRPHRIYPLLAGAGFGFAIVVRYSNLAGVLPLALLFLPRFWPGRRWKALLSDLALFGAGGFLFGFVPLALYTRHLFGTVFRMVYEPTTQSQMSWSNINAGIPYYINALVGTFGLPVVILMGIGLLGGFARPRRRMTAFVCLSALAGFFGFYAIQSIRQLRYLMPAYPFLGVLFAFGVLEVTDRLRRSSLLTFFLLVACAAYPLLRSEPTYFRGIKDGEIFAKKLSEAIPPQSVVLCDDLSGSVRLYADIPGYRFLWTDLPTLRDTLRVLESMKRNVYFLLDSSVAEQYFRRAMATIPGLKERTRLEREIRSLPLYRVWPEDPPLRK